MATKYSIQMDFNKAKRQAQELDDIAYRLDKTANKNLSDSLNALNGDWKGENADKYIKKGFILKEDINETAKSIHKVAALIRTVAKEIYDTEMKNLRIVEGPKQSKAGSSGGGHSSGGGRSSGGGSW